MVSFVINYYPTLCLVCGVLVYCASSKIEKSLILHQIIFGITSTPPTWLPPLPLAIPYLSHLSNTSHIPSRVQAWVGQKLVNVSFYEFFGVWFYKYLRRLLLNEMYYKTIVITIKCESILTTPTKYSDMLFRCFSSDWCVIPQLLLGQLELFFNILTMKYTPENRGRCVRLMLLEGLLAQWWRIVAFMKPWTFSIGRCVVLAFIIYVP